MNEYKQITFEDGRCNRPEGEGGELTMEARIMEDNEIVQSLRCISIGSRGSVLITNTAYDGSTVAETKRAFVALDIAIIRNYDE